MYSTVEEHVMIYLFVKQRMVLIYVILRSYILNALRFIFFFFLT